MSLRQQKLIWFVLLLLPIPWMIYLLLSGNLGAEPIQELQKETGIWSLRILFLALAITPLKIVTGVARIGAMRRMTGLFAFAYACLHVLFWLGVDQGLDIESITTELLKRRYIWFGALAFLILTVMAITSPLSMPKRIGVKNWKRIHRAVYISGILVIIHYVMALKGYRYEPFIYAAILIVLLGIRAYVSIRKSAIK